MMIGRWARRGSSTTASLARYGDRGWCIDEIPEDLPGLRVVVAAHLSCDDSVETARDDQQRHIEVDLEADRRRQRVGVEEVHGRVFLQATCILYWSADSRLHE